MPARMTAEPAGLSSRRSKRRSLGRIWATRATQIIRVTRSSESENVVTNDPT